MLGGAQHPTRPVAWIASLGTGGTRAGMLASRGVVPRAVSRVGGTGRQQPMGQLEKRAGLQGSVQAGRMADRQARAALARWGQQHGPKVMDTPGSSMGVPKRLGHEATHVRCVPNARDE